jgi:hypothetical protein
MLVASIACKKSHDSGHEASAELPNLNNGIRWKADEPTKKGFAQLRLDLEKFDRDHTMPSLLAYNDFAKKLENDVEAIFLSCKMTGDGHIELHKYVALLQKDIAAMKGNDLKSVQESAESFRKNLSRFSEYFE